MQHRAVATDVAERDVLKLDPTLCPLDWLGTRIGFRFQVELVEYILRRREPPLQTCVDFRKPAYGSCQQPRQANEIDDIAGTHGTRKLGPEQHSDQRRQRQGHDDLNQLSAPGLGRGHLQLLATVVVARIEETATLVLLAAEGTHDAVAVDHFRRDMGYIPHGILNPTTDSPKAATRVRHHHPNQRRNRQKYQRELPARKQHGAHHDEHFRTVLDDDFQRIGCRVTNLRDVEGNA